MGTSAFGKRKSNVFNAKSAHRRHRSNLSLPSRVWGQVFRGLGEQICGSTAGDDLGTWPFNCRERLQERIFLNNGRSACKSVPVSESAGVQSFGSVGARGGRARLWFRVQLEVKVLSLAHAPAA